MIPTPTVATRVAGAWSPGPLFIPAGAVRASNGRALTVRMESARRFPASSTADDTRMAAIWHIMGRVSPADLLVVQSGDRRRIGRVGEALFRYFRTEGGRAVVFDFEVENIAAIAALGLDAWHRKADSGPAGDPVALVPVSYDVPLEVDGTSLYPGDFLDLRPHDSVQRTATN